MLDKDYVNGEEIRVDRPSRLFDVALILGLPVTVAEDGKSGAVAFERASLFTVEEWERCDAFLNDCMRAIQDVSRQMLLVETGRFVRGVINLGDLLQAIERIELWEIRTIDTNCNCRPSEPTEKPSWKVGGWGAALRGLSIGSGAVMIAGATAASYLQTAQGAGRFPKAATYAPSIV